MRMFERTLTHRHARHFPVKRFLLLGTLIGAAVYYFSREQNRRALDRKLEELGIKDAAHSVADSAQDGWQKTKEAAQDAGAALASDLVARFFDGHSALSMAATMLAFCLAAIAAFLPVRR